ncbi:hypothetical protein [Serinibacter salmoneus]|uniref:Uncharacterized protein n=1 Tax=Serinibacter salmoneus TaxID=556530 RepID=A0A2A9D1Z5_9MICO|nr:hypothetical protein [Serinibacter salmoneus]PFG20717.1 hypothetical protein ATL40_2327 [Serinibacter salmoneus]
MIAGIRAAVAVVLAIAAAGCAPASSLSDPAPRWTVPAPGEVASGGERAAALEALVRVRTGGEVTVEWVAPDEQTSCGTNAAIAGQVWGCQLHDEPVIELTTTATDPATDPDLAEAVVIHEIAHWELDRALGGHVALLNCLAEIERDLERVTQARAVLAGASPGWTLGGPDGEVYAWDYVDAAVASSIVGGGACPRFVERDT